NSDSFSDPLSFALIFDRVEIHQPGPPRLDPSIRLFIGSRDISQVHWIRVARVCTLQELDALVEPFFVERAPRSLESITCRAARTIGVGLSWRDRDCKSRHGGTEPVKGSIRHSSPSERSPWVLRRYCASL